ncbi:MAG: helix-hairpin-helix domain-containing protein, partial [Lachnospiraceae bacterium]|nr:helix-hairpin-helix domain-containing protein [Lachnospiraceae bacterium]
EETPAFSKEFYRVESYDISNTNGVDTVGAMVVFSNLKPVKKDYRRFKIKTIEGQNDYGALQEMLYRRFKRAQEGDPAFSTLPDMILMDGGQGQVSSAEKIIVAMGLHIPVLGMAKDDSHRTRALVNGMGDEYLLRNNPLLFKYCGTIQEEVHRFAIEYHSSLHSKNSIHSIPDEIEGIGPKKRTALLNHFRTIDDIKNASVEQLMECPGINQKNAEAVHEFFGKRMTSKEPH